MEYFRLRLHDIRYSNKPAIRLKAIRERKNSLRSDNILSLINAAPQALTISNTPLQSPAASHSRPFRKVHQKGCIRLIFYVHPIGNGSPVISKITEKLFERVNFVDKVPTSSGLYECLLKDNATAEFKCTDRMRQQKKKILHKLCIGMDSRG